MGRIRGVVGAFIVLAAIFVAWPGAGRAACVQPPSGMSHWWSGDNNAQDVIGSDNGTLVGDTGYGAGIVGEAFTFDGAGDYVEMTDASTGDFGSADFTVDFWVRFSADEAAGSNNYLMGKSYPDLAQGWDIRLNDGSGTNGKIVVTGINNWGFNIYSTSSPAPDQWHHVALTKTATTAVLYIDGVEEGSSVTLPVSTTSNPFRIGYTSGFGGSAFNGNIDEVRMLNRALSADEVAAIAASGGSGNCRPCAQQPSGLLSWWRGENNGADSVGSNEASLVNGASFAAGRVGQAFRLDGSNDFVQVQNPVGLPLGNAARTMDLWFRTPKNLEATQEGALVQYGSLVGSQMFGLIFSGNCPGKLYFYGHGNDLCGTTTVLPNTWYHGAVTFDGATLNLYLNGRLEASKSTTLDTALDANGLTIGNRPGSNVWQGELDEVKFHAAALTAAEIADIYNARETGTCGTCVDQPADMTHWWGGDGNAADMIGTADGTLVGGATYAAGKVGKSFSFDGASGYVDLPPSSSTALTNDAGTLTAWVKPSAVGDNDMVVVFGSGADGEGVGLGIWGNVRIYHHTGAFDWQTSTPVAAGEWTFLAYTWDGTTERLYKNGQFSESRPRNFSYVPGNGRIGHGWWGDSANYFPGLIDEVQAFNRTMTAEEIKSLFNAGAGGVCPSCAAGPDGMLSQWKAEGNASDSIGNNNGTLVNGSGFASGRIGQAFSFDGTDDYVDVTALTTANFPAAFTIEGWVKADSLPGSIAALAGMAGSYQLDIRSTGVVTFGNSGAMVDSNSVLATGSYYHVAATFDGGNVNIYINGSLDKAGSTTTYTAPATPSFQIGGFGGFPGTFFNGRVDEMGLYNRVLNAGEISAIYQAGAAGICGQLGDIPGLRLWLKPDSGLVLSGADGVAAWEDRSGNGLDVVQSTGASQPTIVSANLNGLPVVRFDGVDDSLRRSTVPGYDLFDNNADTVFIVQKQAGADPQNTTFSWSPDGTNRFLVHATHDDGIYFQASANAGGGDHFGAPQPYGWDDRWHVLKLVKDGSNGQINVDGIDLALASTATLPGNNIPTADFYVGNDIFGNWFTGDIAEILIFSRALTTQEQQSVDAYLRGKYGLTNTPGAFIIPDKVAQPRNSLIESDSITVAGISMLAPVSISAGGEYAVNGGAYTADPGIVVNGDTVTVRQTSSGSYATTTDVTLTIGGVSDTFSVTTIKTYTLTYTAGANGAISGTSPQTVEEGGSGTEVSAVADPGYHFVDWSDSSTANPRTDTNVTGDITVTANFAINTYTLTYTAGANGTISGSTPQTVDHGASGTEVTAVADPGYHFVNWSDGSTANPRTDTNVTGDVTVTANFAINTYTLTYTAGSNGIISGPTPQTVNHGASGTAVTAVADPGYHFVDWSDGATANPRTDTNVTGNIAVTANFAIDHHLLTVILAGSGQGTVTSSPAGIDCGSDCSESYTYNTEVTLTATPATGSRFIGWSGDGDCGDGSVTLTGDLTCTATFSPYFPWLMFNHLFTGAGH